MTNLLFTTGVPDDDDLFTRPPRSARRQQVVERTARRQCRACALTYVVDLGYDGPPLCEGCRADIPATRQRLRALLDSVLERMDAAIAEFEDHIPAYRPYWLGIEEAQIKVDRGEMTQADFDARWAAHKAEGGSWRKIIEYAEERDRTLAALGEERGRLERAMDVLGEL